MVERIFYQLSAKSASLAAEARARSVFVKKYIFGAAMNFPLIRLCWRYNIDERSASPSGFEDIIDAGMGGEHNG